MCTVEKLLIKGIRSFSPENDVALDFGQPLSLIVGHNGAGKTTVIECLKQATTGAMPPNAKNGQSFIHDPQIAGETEVKGLIKLRLRTAQGSPIVVHRSFMLTQQKSRKTFKTLDGSIQTRNPETGELVILSNKCAEIDTMVPYLMNVSKAILEHVVFVHQEDSLWPLSESKPLKEKFDAIFAATKYTAAVGKIKELIKEKNQAIKECKIHLAHLKTHRDTARRLDGSIQREARQEEALKGRLHALEVRSRGLRESVEEAQMRVDEHRVVRDKLQRLQVTLSIKREEVARLKQAVPSSFWDAPGDTVNILKLIEESERARMDAVGAASEQQALADQANATLNRLQGELSGNAEQWARQQAEVKAHSERQAMLKRELHRLAQTYPNLFSELTRAVPADEVMSEVTRVAALAELETLRQRQAHDLMALRARQREEQEAVQQAVSTLAARLEGYAEDVRSKEAEIEANSARRLQLQARARALTLPMKLENLRKDAEVEREALTGRHADAAIRATAQEYADAQSEHRHSVEVASSLRRRRDALAAQSQSATRLRVAQERHAELTAQIEQLLDQHAFTLHDMLLDSGEPGENFRSAVDAGRAAAASSRLARVTRAAAAAALYASNEAAQKAAAKRSELHAAEADLQTTSAECDSLANAVVTALHSANAWLKDAEDDEDPSFDMASSQALQSCIADKSVPLVERHNMAKAELERQHAACLSSCERSRAAHHYGKQWVEHAQHANGCKICQRPFNSKEEQQAFIKRFTRAGENARENIEMDKENANEVAQVLASISAVAGQAQRYQQQQSSLHGLRAKVDMLRKESRALEAKVAEAQQAEQSAAARDIKAQELASEIGPVLAQLSLQLDKAEGEVASLNARLPNSQVGSLAAVEGELAAADAAVAASDRHREEVMSRRTQLAEDKLAMQSRLVAFEQEIVKLESEVAERRQLETQATALDERNAELRAALVDLQANHDPLRREHTARIEKLGSLRSQHDLNENAMLEKVEEFQGNFAAFRGLCDQIASFEAAGTALEAATVAARTSALQAKLMDAKEAAAKHSKKANKQTTLASHLNEVLQDCQRSLQYTQAEEAAIAAAKEIDALQAAAVGRPDLEGDAATLAKVQQDLHEAQLQSSSLSGELAGLSVRIADSRRELGQEQYQGVELEFQRRQVELRTLEMGNKDLSRYGTGLEKALLAFHASKMESVNQSLKELWQRTYRGQDIEYIQIKAETTETGRSSYNYRVIMHAGGAELDMRGRCSAGQKVLACILIRMALAESFCVSCGVIALDEPTTNLDTANSAALAQALRSIIDVRSTLSRETDRAFQLIVITHDEAFATQLGTRAYTEYMTRVTKDESNHSVLSEEPVD